MEVVTAISELATAAGDKPVEELVLDKVEISEDE